MLIQRLICVAHFMELTHRFGVVWVIVRVVFFRQLFVCRLDVGEGGIIRNTKRLSVIS